MSLDLAFDDGQQAIADAVRQFCADRCDDDVVKSTSGSFPRELWSALAELGVLGVLSPEAEGGALECIAAVESLGRAAFPGPLGATFVATQLLEGRECARVASGEAIVCLGVPPLLPWGSEADVFLELGDERVFRAQPAAPLRPVETLGGEPWARGDLERGEELAHGAVGWVVLRLVLAAQSAALGQRLVEDASAHARVRKQFGRPIGDFQAVAHPLADCSMRLAAAGSLARAAAFHFDVGETDAAGRFAAAAHLSASAASLEAAHVCHQVFGAVGITLEGPVFHLSRRIRQLASQAPSQSSSRQRLLRETGFSLAGAPT